MKTFVWTALLIVAAVACAKSGDQREPSVGPGELGARSDDSSSPSPAPAPAPSTSADSDGEQVSPSEGPAASESATGDSGEKDCTEVCGVLDECTERPIPECNARCMSSRWVEGHDTRCLALRISWIDEEGCPRMLETYDSFRGDDDCKR